MLDVYLVTLPLGISFYTFQSMSYTIDLYRGHAQPAKNLLDFACYVSLFPQLVAGPIVRYSDIAHQLSRRSHTIDKFSRGGAFFMGAQSNDPDGPNYDPQAESREGPVREQVVSPFLLSKYEMTQGQWARFAGANPAHYRPGTNDGSWSRTGRPVDLAHPVVPGRSCRSPARPPRCAGGSPRRASGDPSSAPGGGAGSRARL